MHENKVHNRGIDPEGKLDDWVGPGILLVDLDAFFASVEQLDHPGWRGKPVIVGGDADRRGVVSTASYEARAFGVHSAMPSSTARKLCPDAIWTEGHFARYREVSNAVMDILHDETPFVQQVSIDEAFVDVTPNPVNIEHPVRIAERIQRRVRKLGVTCSVGVGTTKAIAKLASDMDKPRGLTVVYPGGEQGFLAPLPVRKLSGIGQASEAKLARLGIRTLGDLARADERMIADALGKNGVVMQMRARGAEEAAVQEDEDAKSVSNEMSFAEDLATREDIEAAVQTMAKKVGRRLRRKGLTGRTVTLKVRYADRSVRTAQTRLHEPTDDEYAMLPQLMGLLDDLWKPPMKLRLVGVAVSGFEDSAEVQDALFDWGDFAGDAPAVAEKRHAIADEKRRRGLLEATDKVKERFGEGAVQFGHDLRMGENTTGSSSKNPADYK